MGQNIRPFQRLKKLLSSTNEKSDSENAKAENFSPQRRKVFFILSTGMLTLAYNACSRGFVSGLDADNLSLSSTSPDNTPPTSSGDPNIPAGGNGAPAWTDVPTIAFTQGVPGRFSIEAYVRDAEGVHLTITKNAAALPAGVTYDAATKSFIYDGTGSVAATSGHILTATEG